MYFVILVIFNFLYEINFNFKTVTPPKHAKPNKVNKRTENVPAFHSAKIRFSFSPRWIIIVWWIDHSLLSLARHRRTAPSRLIRCIAAHDILLLPTPNANKTVRLFAFNDCTTAQPTKCSSSDVHVGVHTRNRRPAGVYAWLESNG